MNISATQTVEDKERRGSRCRDLPKGTPFDDMFEQFFRNHGQNGARRARTNRVRSAPAS